MKVRIKLLYEDSLMPTKAHANDAGFDLYAHSHELDDFGNIVYHTGIAIEIPKGHVGLLFPRSSNAKKDLLLSNSVGVVDSDYRGEVMFKFKGSVRVADINDEEADEWYPELYGDGDRIGQMIIMPYPEIELEESDTLSQTERGTGGYGSSGN